MNYDERRQQLADTLKQQTTGTVRLDKTTSNVFRDRPNAQSESLLDVSQFNHVLNVDPQNNLIETEGMTTYEALVDQSLSHGVMPAVVPQRSRLRSAELSPASASSPHLFATGCRMKVSVKWMSCWVAAKS